MRLQYTYDECSWWKYRLELYHDGRLFKSYNVSCDELEDEIDKIEGQGYNFGFTQKEVEEAKKIYEKRLKDRI
jgi:hypothetical protein